MAEKTGISWCDSTFNPWVGCDKVSPGCAHCYAETLVTGRMGRPGTWGPDGVRQRTSPTTWANPLAWQRDHERFEEKAGHRRRVFCASLADVFEPRPELEPWRRDLFDLIEETPDLDWLILTKRPEVARDWLDRTGWMVAYMENVWLGTSIENARHTWRADVLREIPAAVRFISAEPLLGSLYPKGDSYGERRDEPTASAARGVPAQAGVPPDVRARPDGSVGTRRVGRGADVHGVRGVADGSRGGAAVRSLDLTGIDWLIVGGESGGRNARPMHPEWARELRDACQAEADSRSAFHMKQWGSWRPVGHRPAGAITYLFSDGQAMAYAGPRAHDGGKVLDDIDWCEFPMPAFAAR